MNEGAALFAMLSGGFALGWLTSSFASIAEAMIKKAIEEKAPELSPEPESLPDLAPYGRVIEDDEDPYAESASFEVHRLLADRLAAQAGQPPAPSPYPRRL